MVAERLVGEDLTGENRRSPLTYCVFNKTRESFVSLRVSSAGACAPYLMGLVGKLRRKSDEGIWIAPARGIHTIGVSVAIDLIYLNGEHCVVDVTESLYKFRFGPLRMKCASVLELPVRTIYSSQTQVGDQLLICPQDKLEEYLEQQQIARGLPSTRAEGG